MKRTHRLEKQIRFLAVGFHILFFLISFPVLAAQDAPPPADGGAVGPVPIGGAVSEPVRVRAPQPQYTNIARRACIQGVVVVEAIIDKEGNVTDVKLLKSLPLGLGDAAAKAIMGWKFKPATLHGNPVDVYYNLTVNFTLPNSHRPPQTH